MRASTRRCRDPEHRAHLPRPFRARAKNAPSSRCSRRRRRRVHRSPFEEHAFNEPWEERGHRLTLFSAGHVLGSAQLMIEGDAGRFVYTGDFKLRDSLTVEPPEVKRCDVLLMECTYGRPQYVFPSHEEVAGQMIAFARDALEGDAVPVFFAYSLGQSARGDGDPRRRRSAAHRARRGRQSGTGVPGRAAWRCRPTPATTPKRSIRAAC